jgi:hypothetical protein
MIEVCESLLRKQAFFAIVGLVPLYAPKTCPAWGKGV